MELSALAGNHRLKEQLTRRVQGRGLGHAYILVGPQGSGRHTLARLLAQTMMCTAAGEKRPCGACAQCRKVAEGIHPDLTVLSGPAEHKPITVEQIRTLRADAHIRPNEGARKIYVLEGADEMNASAQNAMLKLLEEGPAYAAFLLVAENPGGLLQTVRSRCEELDLVPVSVGECRQWLGERFPGKTGQEVEAAALSCQGLLGRAVEELEGGEGRQARLTQAQGLAHALESGTELQLFEAAMGLEKGEKTQLIPTLELLEELLVRRMAREGSDRKRLMQAASLVRQLRAAARVNANPGQLAGWLCAGMFVRG